jgi:DNA (cytosine-5)-methyltransferase 1
MKAIDLFAGWGGFTLGAHKAGVDVVWAANHWPLAVRSHALNHPETAHSCQDLRQANWTELPDYDLLLASPACQGHSSASQPRRRRYHDALRATAWAVLDCADQTEPKALLVENVPSFARWRLYPLWRSGLEQLGYHVTEHLIMATAFGVPQRRQRLFIAASRRGAVELVAPRRRVEPAFGPHVQWDTGRWRPIREAGPKAQERMHAGRRRFGKRFVVQHVTGHTGIPLDEALRTVTCQDQWAVVDGGVYRPLTVRETARAMGFPDHYGWPDDATRRDVIKGLGNAVCPPVAAGLVEQLAEAA